MDKGKHVWYGTTIVQSRGRVQDEDSNVFLYCINGNKKETE
jgi:hypothetical protein